MFPALHLFSLLSVAFSLGWAGNTLLLGEHQPCILDPLKGSKGCTVDGYVGSEVLYEDDRVRVWNFTLAPGEITSMHRHDHDYHFVAIQPTELEVWGESGDVLFTFRAEGTHGFKVEGDFLVPILDRVHLPPVPRTHAAKNVGPNTYNEILFESKMKGEHPEL
jgi:hypothetical protein